MTGLLPTDAGVIYAEWVTREGGISAVAFTDRQGKPFLGVCALNRMGKANGLPCWFRRSRLCSDLVIGFKNETPIIIRMFARITSLGLELAIHPPRDIESDFELERFTPWGSEPPSLGFAMSQATEEHWPVNPFPWDIPQ